MLADASRTSRAASILIGGLVVLSLAALAATLFRHANQARTAAEALVAEQIAQEDRTFCGSIGIDPGAPRYAACAQGLMDIRKHHRARVTGDMLGVF